MQSSTQSAGLRINIRKAMSARQCKKKGEIICLGLLSTNEEAAFRTEIRKIQGTYFAKKEVLKKLDEFILSLSKGEWYKMDSQRDIVMHEEAAYQKELASFFIGKKTIATNISWSVPLSFSIGNAKISELYGHVSAVYKNKNLTTAIIIADGEAVYSRYARKRANKPEYAPELIGAYLGLYERFGRGLNVQIAYTRPKKTTEYPLFNEKSQLLTVDFSQLPITELKDRLLSVLQSFDETHDCSACSYTTICSGMIIPKVADYVETAINQKKKDPVFTESQQKVVNFKDGACAVYAVPGAGKTTTLVYRLAELLKNGVEPQNILFVTFTNKAAEEIRQRVKSIINTDFDEELPEIYTYNGLGWQILRDNRDIVGDLKLLTSIDEKRLLMECIDAFSETLTGYSYKYVEGKYGLLSLLLESFKRFSADQETEKQILQNKGKEPEQVLRLKAIYDERLASEQYIDFDQQITLANNLLHNHPEICKKYADRWKYIMADEYQDSSKDDMELLHMIAKSGQRNLVVVGDIDQSIYEWRNASPQYLLDFTKYFPEAKEICMNDNFRSVKPILEASNQLISRNDSRIDMFMVAHQDSTALPFRLKGCTISSIPSILNILHKKNYQYGDIAILSRTNAPLMKLKNLLDEIGIASISPADYLVKDTIYILVKDILDLYFSGFSSMTDKAFFRYLMACGLEVPCKRDYQMTLYDNCIQYYGMTPIQPTMDSMMVYDIEDMDMTENALYAAFLRLYRLFTKFSDQDNPRNALDTILNAFNVDMDYPAVLELKRILDYQDFNSLLEFWQYLTYMCELEDDTKIEQPETPDKVNLMTAHSSKGKEFLAVIILQSEDFKATKEERRLFYVAMTRAKKSLFLLESPYQECELLNEISEYVQISTLC